jgi:hypothetical protein
MLLLGTLILSSCGKNAYVGKNKSSSIISKVRPIEGVKAKKAILDVDIDDIDLGVHTIGETLDFAFVLKNVSEVTINKLKFDIDDKDISIIALPVSSVVAGEQVSINAKIKVSKAGKLRFPIKASFEGKESSAIKDFNINLIGVNKRTQSDGVKVNRDIDKELDYGVVGVGSDYKKDLVLKLDKGAKITKLSLAEDSVFSVKEGVLCESLAPGYCLIEVTFDPNLVGQYEDNLIVEFEDKAKKALNVKLIGKADAIEQCELIHDKAIFPKSRNELTKEDSENLPYFVERSNTQLKLEAIANLDFNKFIKPLDYSINYVEDAQVVVSYNLPKNKGEVKNIEMHTNLLKSISPGEHEVFHRTEIMCETSSKLCSGQSFLGRSSYVKHVDKSYEYTNKVFSNVIMSESSIQRFEDVEFRRLTRTFDFDELYGEKVSTIKKNAKENNKLRVVFADDIKLEQIPQLNVKYTKACNL